MVVDLPQVRACIYPCTACAEPAKLSEPHKATTLPARHALVAAVCRWLKCQQLLFTALSLPGSSSKELWFIGPAEAYLSCRHHFVTACLHHRQALPACHAQTAALCHWVQTQQLQRRQEICRWASGLLPQGRSLWGSANRICCCCLQGSMAFSSGHQALSVCQPRALQCSL